MKVNRKLNVGPSDRRNVRRHPKDQLLLSAAFFRAEVRLQLQLDFTSFQPVKHVAAVIDG